MRRRRRAPADPETAAALAVLDRYEAMLQGLEEAGDRFAAERLRGVRWTRREIGEWGLDFISRLKAGGYAREIERLARQVPAEVHPAIHWVNGPGP